MRVLIILAALTFLVGCSTLGNVRTTLVMPNGDTYEVSSKADAHVVLKKGDVEINVDNRGRPGLIEQVIASQLSEPIVKVDGK